MPDPTERTDETRIPIVEERASIGVRESQSHITVMTRAVQEDVRLSEDLHHRRVEIERVPCDRIVDAPPVPREEDGITILSVVEEELVVTRRLRLVEEIRMTPVVVEETVERTEKLRRLVPEIRREEDRTPPRR